jgi:hypothetical protein
MNRDSAPPSARDHAMNLDSAPPSARDHAMNLDSAPPVGGELRFMRDARFWSS